jgi:hypothetical protein
MKDFLIFACADAINILSRVITGEISGEYRECDVEEAIKHEGGA